MPRALLSVTDKAGLPAFAAGLVEVGYDLISTGGTLRALQAAGLPARPVEEVTGFPEILGGRVKTLHPKVHGGLLGRADRPDDAAQMGEHGVEPIDLACVNLYRFEEAAAGGLEEAGTVEQIDIGGPAMLRSAAKNFARVAVVSDPAQYAGVLEKLRGGGLTRADRRDLAAAAFARTAAYDAAIAGWFGAASVPDASGEHGDEPFPDRFAPVFRKRAGLRYGENPHQRAAFYVEPNPGPATLAAAEQLHGKELSYNNLLDLDAARGLIREFAEPACAVLKHTNPCGCAVHDDPAEAFRRAYAGDPTSAFGSVIALNRPVNRELAEALCETAGFVEALLAPAFADDAVEVLTTRPVWKRNVRLMALPGLTDAAPVTRDLRRVSGGLLVQDRDEAAPGGQADDPAGWACVTDRPPTAAERADLAFAWRAAKHLKSNAVCFCRDRQLVGAGAGQMSRLDSVRIAAGKAGGRARGGVCGSDAFFPFRDGVDAAAAAGVTAVVQPGGSKRDAEAIAAADEHGLTMLFTGRRHFRH